MKARRHSTAGAAAIWAISPLENIDKQIGIVCLGNLQALFIGIKLAAPSVRHRWCGRSGLKAQRILMSVTAGIHFSSKSSTAEGKRVSFAG